MFLPIALQKARNYTGQKQRIYLFVLYMFFRKLSCYLIYQEVEKRLSSLTLFLAQNLQGITERPAGLWNLIILEYNLVDESSR